ncbi:glycosyltransferase family 2 protein [Desertimonas flava]|uniref:glycosyltransferase family 2 protein n=1 Tax=Desertimonas flava TaxID=2064846 RepID=UPI0013C4CADF|nr:glycosyltransferase family 2 protein [Desertimonas flava]
MELAAVTMLRNEKPILGPYLDQLQEFFDHCVIIDHSSTDGSGELVRSRARRGWEIYRLQSARYPQAELANHFWRHLAESTEAEWFFFLDCDEFLPFPHRAALDERLAAVSSETDLLSTTWRNAVPMSLDGGDIFAGRFWTRPTRSEVKKIVASRRLLERSPTAMIQQGYHDVVAPGIQMQQEDLATLGLIHIPVQSRYRFAVKIHLGGRLMIENASMFRRNQGRHWANLYLGLEAQGMGGFDFELAGLDYPMTSPPTSGQREELAFAFDYVQTPYVESLDDSFFQIFRTEPDDEAMPTLLLDPAGNQVVGFPSDVAELPLPNLDPDDIGERQSGFSGLDDGSWAALVEAVLDDSGDGVLGEPRPGSEVMRALVVALQPRVVVDIAGGDQTLAVAAALTAERCAIPCRVFSIEGSSTTGETVDRSDISRYVTNLEFVSGGVEDTADEFADGSVEILRLGAGAPLDDVGAWWSSWAPRLSNRSVVIVDSTASLGAQTRDSFSPTFVGVDLPAGRPELLLVRAGSPLANTLVVHGRAPELARLVRMARVLRAEAEVESSLSEEQAQVNDADRQRLAILEYRVGEILERLVAITQSLETSRMSEAAVLSRLDALEETRSGRNTGALTTREHT